MILVTGGSGFVGSKVVRALRDRGLPVRCLVRRPERATELSELGCELVQGDMTDAGSLRRAADGCETVVHLVAIIVGKPGEFEAIMIQGTRDLLAAAEAAGARRIVLMSALGTGEETKDLVPYYGAKWAMEQAAQASPLDHVIFRPSFVFGTDGGILPMFVRQVRWSPVTPVIGPGTQRLQPIWVDDVAAFFARAIDHEGAAGRTFDLGGPDRVTWNELFDRIKSTIGARRGTLHVPFSVARAGAALAELLPKPPVTRDQLTMLAHGDNVGDVAPAIETFGIEPIGLDEQLRRAA